MNRLIPDRPLFRRVLACTALAVLGTAAFVVAALAFLALCLTFLDGTELDTAKADLVIWIGGLAAALVAGLWLAVGALRLLRPSSLGRRVAP